VKARSLDLDWKPCGQIKGTVVNFNFRWLLLSGVQSYGRFYISSDIIQKEPLRP